MGNANPKEMPEWLQWTLKISQTAMTGYLTYLIVDTVKCYGKEIKKNVVLVSIYLVMSLTLAVNLFDVWIDPLISQTKFLLTIQDIIIIATDYLMYVFIQLVLLHTMKSVLLARD
jgi:hypothetical protein